MKDIWQKIHTDYTQQDWINKPSIFAEQAITYFPDHGSLLELGGGLGQDSAYFKGKGYDVLLTDLSSEVLAKATEKHGLLTKQLDLNKPLPFSDHSFDVVYAHLSLHYFDQATTLTIFNEIKRVLKPGGIAAALFNSTSDPEYGTGEKIEEGYYEINSLKKRFVSPESLAVFLKPFETIILDNDGETYKDAAKGIHNLVRFIGKI